jgi:hypothetical protein
MNGKDFEGEVHGELLSRWEEVFGSRLPIVGELKRSPI